MAKSNKKTASNGVVEYYRGDEHLHTWECSLPATIEDITEAVMSTGLVETNDTVRYLVNDADGLACAHFFVA